MSGSRGIRVEDLPDARTLPRPVAAAPAQDFRTNAQRRLDDQSNLAAAQAAEINSRIAQQRLAMMDANTRSWEDFQGRVPVSAFGMTVGVPGARTTKPDPLGAPAPGVVGAAGPVGAGMPSFTRFDEDSAPTAAVRPPTPQSQSDALAAADRRRAGVRVPAQPPGVMDGVGAPASPVASASSPLTILERPPAAGLPPLPAPASTQGLYGAEQIPPARRRPAPAVSPIASDPLRQGLATPTLDAMLTRLGLTP
jgi:hypothetical protein